MHLLPLASKLVLLDAAYCLAPVDPQHKQKMLNQTVSLSSMAAFRHLLLAGATHVRQCFSLWLTDQRFIQGCKIYADQADDFGHGLLHGYIL